MVLGFLLASPNDGRAAGTHYLLEGEGGVGVTDTSTLTGYWGLNLGYGGKLRGFPWRFYLIGGFLQSSGSHEFANSISMAQRESVDNLVAAGIRIYMPLMPNVRLFFQTMLGYGWSDSEWMINDIERYTPHDSALGGRIAGGIQARLAPWVSLGLNFERVSFWGRENDPAVAAMTGFDPQEAEGDQYHFGLMAAVHF